MIDSLLVKFALIGVIGIAAQWVAWRTGRPAIALMLGAGILVGPVLGLIVPERDFGELQEPIIKLAVAVILFEGGLSLNFRDLREAGPTVLRLVVIGVPIGWMLGALAAYYGAGISWEVALLFGGILVVTGPTVIGPMLRNLPLPQRVADTLRWEGIVNDPIGALLAVAIFSWIAFEGSGRGIDDVAAEIVLATLLAGGLGFGLGWWITYIFPRGLVPEYLKAPVLLVTVLAGFVAADIIMHETGLVTVTIMGIVMANRPLHSSRVLRRFKEDLAVILITGVFIILSATLDWEVLSAFRVRFILFLLLLLFVVRPVTVLVSLLFSSMPWRERLFIAWIAPRGIVAVTISGLFAMRLVENGVPDGEALVPLSFGVVIATILAHGFTARRLAERLGIMHKGGEAVLLVGANDWTIALGEHLKGLGVPVTIADSSTYALRAARRRDLDIYRGDILNEVNQHELDLKHYQQLLAATENDAYNALVCADLGPEMGFERLTQTAPEPAHGQRSVKTPTRGRTLLRSDRTVEELQGLIAQGWEFRQTRITEKYPFEEFAKRLTDGIEMVAVLDTEGVLRFIVDTHKVAVEEGDTVISFAPPEPPAPREKRQPATAPGAEPSAAL